ncbi:hypothetical protein FQZ97_523230 [compost metagenome]
MQAQHRLPALHQATGRLVGADPLAVDHQHLGQQATRVQGDEVGIELDQRPPRLDPLALLDQTGEALAGEAHRIQADMHHHLHTAVGREGDGVAAALHIADQPGDGRAQGLGGGVDGNPVAHHLAGEDRIGDLFQGHEYARQRGDEIQYVRRGHEITCCCSFAGGCGDALCGSCVHCHQYSTCRPMFAPWRALSNAPLSDSALPAASRLAARCAAAFHLA